FKEALESYRKSVGDDHPECIEVLRLLAALQHGRGDFAAAEPLLKQSADIVRRLFGEDSAFLAPPLTQLADCHRARGDHSAAETRYRQALDIVRKARSESGQPAETGQPHVPGKLPFLDRSLSMILNNLALLYAALGRKGQAEPLLRQALEVDRDCLGEEHADSLFNLAIVCAAGGREDSTPSTQGAPAARELLLLHRQIAAKMLNGPGFEGPATHERLISQWQERVARLEREIGATPIAVNCETVAKALPADTALI